ncbi:hypothetical protein M8J77_013162 [Diaphorina citri]|nr:hypothetical protein M8J77_013162 [Diaphorina citri]
MSLGPPCTQGREDRTRDEGEDTGLDAELEDELESSKESPTTSEESGTDPEYIPGTGTDPPTNSEESSTETSATNEESGADPEHTSETGTEPPATNEESGADPEHTSETGTESPATNEESGADPEHTSETGTESPATNEESGADPEHTSETGTESPATNEESGADPEHTSETGTESPATNEESGADPEHTSDVKDDPRSPSPSHKRDSPPRDKSRFEIRLGLNVTDSDRTNLAAVLNRTTGSDRRRRGQGRPRSTSDRDDRFLVVSSLRQRTLTSIYQATAQPQGGARCRYFGKNCSQKTRRGWFDQPQTSSGATSPQRTPRAAARVCPKSCKLV